MKSYQRILLIILCFLLAATGAGLILTSDWGSRAVSSAKRASGQAQSPIDMRQMQTAMALAPLAATSEEQDRARDALRAADHEVDFEFAASLFQAASQPIPSTPEIKAILERISNAEKNVADDDSDIARLTKLVSSTNGNQKQDFASQLELAKARQELNEDELSDADEDLERAGGDPHSRIERMVEEHNAAAQDHNGELDLSSVGKQAGATLPASNSFLERIRAMSALHSFLKRLGQAEHDADAKAAIFSSSHDEFQKKLETGKAQQSKNPSNLSPASVSDGNSGNTTAAPPGQTESAISSYRSLMAIQKKCPAWMAVSATSRTCPESTGNGGRWPGHANGACCTVCLSHSP
jgi:hypothetical protein